MKYPRFHSLFLPAAVWISIASWAHSATLVNYQFTTSLAPTSVGVGVSSDDLNGAGTGRSSGSYAFQYPTSTNAGYMQFTLTADPGSVLSFTSISFSYDFLQSSGTQTPVDATFALYYSTDSFATSTLIQSFSDTSGAIVSAPVFSSSGTLNLSTVPTVSTLTFRFVLTNSANLNSSAYRYTLDNVAVMGSTIPVPEPATAGLWMGGLLLGMARELVRKRRSPGI